MIEGLLKGILVGVIVSIPVGPLGLLCIPRTLTGGRWSGLAVGLGGTASDAVYSGLALFALSFINGFIDAHEGWVLLAGGIIMSITGLSLTARGQRPEQLMPVSMAVTGIRRTREALNGFLISVTNPGTLVCMLWLYTFLDADTVHSGIMSVQWAGTVIGSAISWFLITWGVDSFKERLSIRQTVLISRIFGAIIVIIGIISLTKSLTVLL